MGMSASQARYLQLTARKSDLEYKAQQICQARMMLSNSTESLAQQYNKSITNHRLFYVPDSETYTGNTQYDLLSYYAITLGFEEGGMGCRVVDALGNVVRPVSPETYDEGLSQSDYLIDPDITNSEYLEECLREGVYFLSQPVTKNGSTEVTWEMASWQSCTNIRDTLYTSDDAEATTVYESKLAEVQHKDKLLEMDLKKIETEQKAVQSEMEAVKKVVEKATEVFKDTFG